MGTLATSERYLITPNFGFSYTGDFIASRALQTISSVGPFFYGLFVGLPRHIFDVWIRPPLLIINHSI